MLETKDKIVNWEQLKGLVQIWHNQNFKIVFTNGCFDILHLGHVDYLEKARQKGDKLIIGLNSDSSVRSIKGESRPIVNEISRSRLLAALQFVDAVTLFDEQTPNELIKYIVPDILVKGNDYNISNIVGADTVLQNGGKVETVELVEGFSTTNIIEKIKKVV